MSTFNVGFGGGGTTTAPALVREVSADQLREVRVHVSSQTAGQWSQAGILIRAPGPIDNVGANDNFFTFGGFREGGTGLGGTGFSATTQNVVNGGEAEMNTTGVVAAELDYLRVVHLGTGDFQTYSSTDGVTWVLRQEFQNTGLATGTLEVGLWGGTFAGSNIMGGASAAFDYIQIDEAPDAPEALLSWADDGSGDWNRSNWSVVGGKPDSNISVAILGAGEPLEENATVYTNQNNTIKQLQFDNATFSYTVAGPGTLTLDADAGNALIDVISGTHEIQTDLLLNDNVTATAAAGTTLNINARIHLNGRTFTTAGAGTINLNNGTVVAGSAAGAVANEGQMTGLGGVEGDFSQSAGGILGVTVGGEPIQVTGDAVLGGVLDVSLADGFTPLAGQSYPVLTADSVTDLGLSLSGEHAGLFRLSVSEGALSLVAAAVPEPAAIALMAMGLSAAALTRRRRPVRASSKRRADWIPQSGIVALAAFLFALCGATAHAQFGTFRDDFGNDAAPHAQQHNYQPGTVPAGGIWTGVHNSMNGGGPFPPPDGPFTAADFVADGFDFAGADKAGKLLIEDLVLHPNTDGQFGVGWEEGINNAPFLYREVPADAKLTVTMKIDAQNSGQWHYAPIIARLKAPTGAPPTPVGFGRG
ncbi:MAG TPA: PEP-CTERM sorting domain-containing protein, partial [Lacipirellulaceae bacterium]